MSLQKKEFDEVLLASQIHCYKTRRNMCRGGTSVCKGNIQILMVPQYWSPVINQHRFISKGEINKHLTKVDYYAIKMIVILLHTILRCSHSKE